MTTGNPEGWFYGDEYFNHPDHRAAAQAACEAVFPSAGTRLIFADLLAAAGEDQGPFGDHLRNHLYRMAGDEKLQAALLQIIRHKRCPDERLFFRLRGAGLVRRAGDEVLPRNPLYAAYFGRRLHG